MQEHNHFCMIISGMINQSNKYEKLAQKERKMWTLSSRMDLVWSKDRVFTLKDRVLDNQGSILYAQKVKNRTGEHRKPLVQKSSK